MSLKLKVIIGVIVGCLAILVGFSIGQMKDSEIRPGKIKVYSKQLSMGPIGKILTVKIGIDASETDILKQKHPMVSDMIKQADLAQAGVIIFEAATERKQVLFYTYSSGDKYVWVKRYNHWFFLANGEALQSAYRGCIEVNKKNFQQAEEQCSQALAISPELTMVRVMRGLSYMGINEFPKALADYDIALAATHESDVDMRNYIYYDRSRVNFDLQNDKMVIEDSLSYIAGIPDKSLEDPYVIATAYNNIAWTMATSRNSELINGEEALRYIKQAEALNLNATISLIISDTYAAVEARLGNYEAAVARETKVIAMNKEKIDEEGVKARLLLYQSGKAYTQEKR